MIDWEVETLGNKAQVVRMTDQATGASFSRQVALDADLDAVKAEGIAYLASVRNPKVTAVLNEDGTLHELTEDTEEPA